MLCPGDQLVLRAVRVAVRVPVYRLSSLAAGSVRNAVQDVQKSSQSPLLFAHLIRAMVQWSIVIRCQGLGLSSSPWCKGEKDFYFTTVPELSPHPQCCSWLKHHHKVYLEQYLCYVKHWTALNHVPLKLGCELLYILSSAFKDCQRLHSALLWKEINVQIDWNGSKQLRTFYNCAEGSSEWSCCLSGNEKGTACFAAKYIYFLTVEIVCLNEAQAAMFPNYEGQRSTLHWVLHSWEFYCVSQRKLHKN